MAGMVSCSDDLPDPPAQSYPNPDGIFEDSGLVVAQDLKEVNLKSCNEQNINADMAGITSLVNFPDSYELQVFAEVSGTEDFANSMVVNTIIEETTDDLGAVTARKITINPDVLNGAIQSVISKKPGTYSTWVRYAAYAVRNNTNIRLGGMNAFYGTFEYNVTTLDPTTVIEENYYLVGSFCDWDISKALKFNNTVAGANQYDNPQFSVKVDVTEAQANEGFQWMVIPASTYTSKDYASGAFGVKGESEAASGILNPATAKGESAGLITNAGPMLITINMELDTYTVGYALDELYVFTAAKNAFAIHTSDYINYTGVAALGTVYYLADEPSMKAGTFFKQAPDTEPVLEAEGIQSGQLTSKSDGTNIKSPLKGTNFYWMEVNLAQLTYKMSHISSISVIGAGNGWDLATAPALTPSSDYKTWTAKGVQIGDEFKLNCNGAWDLDFGGTKVETVVGSEQSFNLVFKGGNMQATPGTYDIEVNFGTYPYTITLK